MMEPVTIITGITAVIPVITAAIKKLVGTDRMEEEKRRKINSLIPVVIGIVTAGLYEYMRSGDLIMALVVGLGSGTASAGVRDIDKNLNLVGALRGLMKKDPPAAS